MGSSGQVTPLGSYRGSSPAMDRRGWNLALGFQEVFTAVVRVRYNRQAVQDAETFRGQMRQALRVAEQDARSHGCSPEDVNQVIFGVVAFLDESVLSSGNPVFANWPRLPLQAELFGHQLAGEMFFPGIAKSAEPPRFAGDGRSARGLLPVPAARFQGTLCGGRRPAVDHVGDSRKDPASARAGGTVVSTRRDSRRCGTRDAIRSRERLAGKIGAYHRRAGRGAVCRFQNVPDVGCVSHSRPWWPDF